jgi:hypothetical protein
MPINYKLYSPTWKTQIVPLIRERSGNRCEKCRLINYSVAYRDQNGVFQQTYGNIAHDLMGEGPILSITEMSLYTEFKTKLIKLRKDTPAEVIEFLNNWLNKENPDWNPPFDHQLFKEERWGYIFTKGHYNASLFVENRGQWTLFIHTRINYGTEEINQFVSWITPFVIGHKPMEYIGWKRMEGYSEENVYIQRDRPVRGEIHFKIMT